MSENTKGISDAITLEERIAGAASVVDDAPVGAAPPVEAAPEKPSVIGAAPADIVPDPRQHIALDLGSFIHVQNVPVDEVTGAPLLRQLFLTIGGVRWAHVGEHRGVWLYRLDK